MFSKSILAAALLAVSAPAFAQGINPGNAMLAGLLGVDPTQYSQVQLIQLDTAKREGNVETYNYILANPDNLVTRSGSYSSNVTPADYSDRD